MEPETEQFDALLTEEVVGPGDGGDWCTDCRNQRYMPGLTASKSALCLVVTNGARGPRAERMLDAFQQYVHAGLFLDGLCDRRNVLTDLAVPSVEGRLALWRIHARRQVLRGHRRI